MITVNLFANVVGWDERDQSRAERSLSAVKALRAVRYAKAVPSPALYLEVATATLDLIRAYADYRQAQEITHQLMVEGVALVRLIDELYRQQSIDIKLKARESTFRQARTNRQLEERIADVRLTQEKFIALSRQARKLGNAIATLRESAPPRCSRLAKLEDVYYRFMDVHLQLATSRLDARPAAEPTTCEDGTP